MLLVLMRHGIAKDGEPDEARELTPKGRERVHRIGLLMKRMNIKPDYALSSMRVRAIQTAEEILKAMRLDLTVQQTNALDFYSPWEAFESAANGYLAGEPEDVTIFAAGHQPQIGMLLNMALTGTDEDVAVRKGAVMGLRFPGSRVEAGTADLEFAFTHGAIRELEF